jgi:hypothetical protein
MLSTKIFPVVLSDLSTYSKVSIVDPAQPMDYRDISNTVDSTCKFRVAGAAVNRVILFSVLRLYRKRALRKLAKKIFDHLSYF